MEWGDASDESSTTLVAQWTALLCHEITDPRNARALRVSIKDTSSVSHTNVIGTLRVLRKSPKFINTEVWVERVACDEVRVTPRVIGSLVYDEETKQYCLMNRQCVAPPRAIRLCASRIGSVEEMAAAIDGDDDVPQKKSSMATPRCSTVVEREHDYDYLYYAGVVPYLTIFELLRGHTRLGQASAQIQHDFSASRRTAMRIGAATLVATLLCAMVFGMCIIWGTSDKNAEDFYRNLALSVGVVFCLCVGGLMSLTDPFNGVGKSLHALRRRAWVERQQGKVV